MLFRSLFHVSWISDYSWFIGCGLGYVLFLLFERRDPRIPTCEGETEGISDGTVDAVAEVAASEAPVLAQTVQDAGTAASASGAVLAQNAAAAPDSAPVLANEVPDAATPASALRRPTAGPSREALA